HAILIYLSCAFPGVASHWYPSDLSKRSKLHSVLDWHHTNLRRGSVELVFNTTLGPLKGLPQNAEAAKEGEKLLLSTIDSKKDHDRILSPYKKVLQWIEDTKSAMAPHFDEVHGILFKVQKKIRDGMTEMKAKL
ncbi:glutathione S-transferase T1-like protein, partial [Tanacetum coccineum]